MFPVNNDLVEIVVGTKIPLQGVLDNFLDIPAPVECIGISGIQKSIANLYGINPDWVSVKGALETMQALLTSGQAEVIGDEPSAYWRIRPLSEGDVTRPSLREGHY